MSKLPFFCYYFLFINIYIKLFPFSDAPHNLKLPVIHIYSFSTASDPILDIAERVSNTLRCDVSDLGEIISTSALGLKLGAGTGGPNSSSANSIASSFEGSFIDYSYPHYHVFFQAHS
jgi:hypothetical protein